MRTAAAILGVLFMATIAEAQKEQPKEPPKRKLKAPYVEFVEVRIYHGGKDFEFFKPAKQIGAFHKTIAGKDCIILNGGHMGGFPVKAKSEITDSKGVKWIVTEDRKSQQSESGTEFACPVVKAPAPKKK